MPDIVSLLQQGQSHAGLFALTALALGFLHGLEPGHSKTMMAAFIIAIRGTVAQAVLLGLSAAFSHSAVVWVVALVGLSLGGRWNGEGVEGWFQMTSGLGIVGMAVWMVWRLRREQRPHDHDHDHDEEHDHHHGEAHHHDHDHDEEEMDAHERAHAEEIARRFTGGHVTTGQVVLFGLTGGLVPCPASITVLMVCLQLKKVTLGVSLVICFSLGLALTMVLSGVLAALSLRHVSKRWNGFGTFAKKAPWASCVLIFCLGLFFFWQGLRHVMG